MADKNTQHKIVTGDLLNYVYMLSNGATVNDVAIFYELKIRTLEAKLLAARKQFEVENTTHLVAYFLRNNLIK